MATETPDVRNLKSWKEAFQYPIPTVRKVEQELRRDIASNKEKLRSLVGTRYRELLGTAETIIEMSVESSEVESRLASIGIRCNTSLIGKKSVNLTDINRDSTGRTEGDKAFAGQLALLHRCTTVTGRLLRKHDSPLLASKLMVISRLLYKTLSQHPSTPPFLESLRSQLSYVQKLIRRRIDRRLGSANSSVEDIIDSMAAFCLSNNASSLDVITHFHNIRFSYIGKRLGRDNGSECIPKALSLYIQTLQHTKVLFSRRLSDALGKLQAQPLLNDHDIQKLDDIDLDILGRWVVPDVKNFTPWIKSDALTKQSAEQTLKAWSKKAFQVFLERGAATLGNSVDFAGVLALRKRTLDIWLAAVSTTLTHSSTAQKLLSVDDSVKSHLTKWEKTEVPATQSLWNPDLLSLEVSEGATTFKRAIIETLLGQDAKITNYEMEDTLDEDEDEEFQTSAVELLSKDDPHLLREEQIKTVRQALLDLQKSFEDTTKTFDSKNSDKAAFVLRLIRDLRRESPNILQGDEVEFAEGVVPELHDILAQEVLSKVPASKIIPPSNKITRVPGRSLWEKTPELPIQPLPSTFKYFKRLVEAMEDLGPDLWNPSAVGILKQKLHNTAVDSFGAKLEQLKSPDSTEEEKEADEADEAEEEEKPSAETDSNIARDWKIQLLLDAFYIRDVLSMQMDGTSPLDELIETLQGECDEDGIAGTLQEAAHEFWSRTQLLLGLLAGI
uniref:Conserved oligomeric Golgi complex subunit 1 n=1 Tax=Talaromyces marneffei PM1 TaxID=1077442 RepID=A0A093VR12_TALMA